MSLASQVFAVQLTFEIVHLCPATQAAELRVFFTRIADTSTPIPGGTGSFTDFYQAPSNDGGNVAFRGDGPEGQIGVYRYVEGQLAVVADKLTPIPDGHGTFTSFREPSIEGRSVALYGCGPDSQCGVYSDVGGLHMVADRQTAIPKENSNFAFLGPPVLGGGKVAFEGLGGPPLTRNGLYVEGDDGGLVVIADRFTTAPGGSGTFAGINSPIAKEGSIVAFQAFVPQPSSSALFSTDGGLHRILDRTIVVPGNQAFSTISQPSLSEGNIAFAGITGLGNGIYAYLDGVLIAVADPTTMMPGVSQAFAIVGGGPSISGSAVAFTGEGEGGEGRGLFLRIGFTIHVVIRRGGLLDGRTMERFSLGGAGLDGSTLAFKVTFQDSTKGIYLATLGVVGDIDFDGRSTLDDYAMMIGCLGGPDGPPDPPEPLTSAECLRTFDADSDELTDLNDLAWFQNHFAP